MLTHFRDERFAFMLAQVHLLSSTLAIYTLSTSFQVVLAAVMAIAARSVAKKVRGCNKVDKKPVAKTLAKKPVGSIPKPVDPIESKRVVINGRVLELPAGWDLKRALQEVMVSVPCKKLEKIAVPTTLVEVYHMVPPRVFASSNNMPLAVAYDDNFELYWRGSGGCVDV